MSRTCFNCGEAGHLAAKCPKAPTAGPRTRPVRSLDEVEGVPKILDCRLLANDGYTRILRSRRRGAERLRRQPKLEERGTNRFAALEAETSETRLDRNGSNLSRSERPMLPTESAYAQCKSSLQAQQRCGGKKLCQSYNAKICEDDSCAELRCAETCCTRHAVSPVP